MASSLPVVIDDDLLHCKLCCRNAVRPILLPCLHVFCEACLKRHVARAPTLDQQRGTTHARQSGMAQTAGSHTAIPEMNQVSETQGSARPGESAFGVEEDSYEIPQRTIDDYGYQIADEQGCLNYQSNAYYNYCNRPPDSPASPQYIDMTNGQKKSRSLTKASRKGKAAMTLPETTHERVLRTMSQTSNEYVELDPVSPPVESDVYDDIDVSSYGESRSNPNRKSGSPKDVRRWKVSGKMAPPMMVIRKKSRPVSEKDEPVDDGGQSVPLEPTSHTIASQGLFADRLPPGIEDIYSEEGSVSPPVPDLYGTAAANSSAIYSLQKRLSDEYPGRISPLPADDGEQVDSGSFRNSTVYGKRFQCPVCDDVSTTPDETDRSVFETCSFIEAIQEMSSFYAEEHTNCSDCNRNHATHRCFDCKRSLCDACRGVHDSHNDGPRHRVLSLGELRYGKHKNELKSMLSSRCLVHGDNAVEYLCIPCRRAICSACLDSSEHEDHWAAPLDEVANRERSYLQSAMDSAKQKTDKVAAERDKLGGYRLRCDEERLATIRQIVNQKDSLVRQIEAQCESLVNKVERDFGKEKRRIEDGLTVLDRLKLKIQGSCRFVGQLLEHGRSADVVTLAPAAKDRLHALQTVVPPKVERTLAVGFHPTVFASDDVEQLYGLLSVERTVPGETEPVEASPVDQDGSDVVTVNPRLLWSFPTKTITDDKGCKPTGVAAIPNSDEIVLVDDINKKLKIFRLDGILQGEICPTSDRRLVDPWDVAVLEGSGNLAVTDRGARDVKVFTQTGEFVTSFGSHFSNPWGIATNSLQNILVTDIVRRKVFVHDADGNLVSTIPAESRAGSYLRCPEYVAVNVNDDVIVSDFEQHSVVIFDKFGRFISKYGDRHEPVRRLKVPCGVSVDRKGDIYVADYNNRRIVRIGMNGQLRCHYVTNDAHLVMPQALVVSRDDNIVVVDRTHVKVFSLSESSEKDDKPKPKPKPRKKGDGQRRRTAPGRSSGCSPSHSAAKEMSSLPHDASLKKSKTSKVKGRDSDKQKQQIDKSFLETEVW